MRRDYVEYAKQNPEAIPPPHFRHTFPTLGPPLALEQLLTQLRARWVPVRQTGPAGAGAAALATGAHLTVEGRVYAIGSDWLVRVGNVIISPGGAMKGMLLEVRRCCIGTCNEKLKKCHSQGGICPATSHGGYV